MCINGEVENLGIVCVVGGVFQMFNVIKFYKSKKCSYYNIYRDV